MPARTRRPWHRSDAASVRARSHAALSGARRSCFRACPLARGAVVGSKTRKNRWLGCRKVPRLLQAPDCYCFSLNTCRGRAVFCGFAVLQKLCLRSGSRIRQKRPSVRARSNAAPLVPRRRHFRACPLARGALGTAPRMLACVPVRPRRLRGVQNSKNSTAWLPKNAPPFPSARLLLF